MHINAIYALSADDFYTRISVDVMTRVQTIDMQVHVNAIYALSADHFYTCVSVDVLTCLQAIDKQ